MRAVIRRAKDEAAGKVAEHTYIVDEWDGNRPIGEYVACPYRFGNQFDIQAEIDDIGKTTGLDSMCGGCGADVSGIIETRGEHFAD